MEWVYWKKSLCKDIIKSRLSRRAHPGLGPQTQGILTGSEKWGDTGAT